MKLARILIAVMLAGSPVCAQHAAPTGWDFSYTSVLERNSVPKNELIWSWLGRYKSPIETWFSTWQGKPIVSSILIEYPAFHAGEHSTIWLVRTSDEAFYWFSVETQEQRQEEPIAPQAYDAIYKLATSWQQLTPKPPKELHKDVWPGYFGFLSIHGPNGSKQMLLTVEDFMTCLDKSYLPGKLKPGRLMAALEPVLIPESRKNYKHKSEAEIARMTPAQRIDEQIREYENHDLDPLDKQSELIERYRRRDGLAGIPYLIQLIDSYELKEERKPPFQYAVMFVKLIDNKLVRLRSSPEGRKAIEAIERLGTRTPSLEETENDIETDLLHMKGVNITDEAVRDTLWVKYRIKLSDSELLAFSNYLAQFAPTYPTWSRWDIAQELSPITESGQPRRAYVMKKPLRYYQAYLAFGKRAVSPIPAKQSAPKP